MISRSRTIGVIADASPRHGPGSALAAVESAARNAGTRVSMAHVAEETPADVPVVVLAPRETSQAKFLYEDQELGRGLRFVIW